jgi:type 1 glutamine amidotransferase
LRDGKWTKLQAPGPGGGHGPRQEFLVSTFAPPGPIMKDLPDKWLHTEDELYCSLRGPAEKVNVLGHGLSTLTHEEEPLLMTLTYGKGRIFHTTLGHHLEALNGLGFQITFTRGSEWAATGKVTLKAPKPGELTASGKAAARIINVKRPTP